MSDLFTNLFSNRLNAQQNPEKEGSAVLAKIILCAKPTICKLFWNASILETVLLIINLWREFKKNVYLNISRIQTS